MRIRRARAVDLPAVQALLVATWHDTYDVLLGREAVDAITARWHSRAALSLQASAAGMVFLVADGADGTIVGTALADAAGTDESIIHLRRLYVSPSRQGAGIGTGLLAEVTKAFPAGRLMRLEVDPRNARAIRFYERSGFGAVGFAGTGGQADEPPALVMERANAAG